MKRVKTKKVNNLCPSCNEDLSVNGIGSAQMGTKLWDLSVSGGELQYDEKDFEVSEGDNFYCQGCGEDLDLEEEEVIEILSL